MSFINDIKLRYKGGNIVEKLIYINLAVFISTILISVLQGLYNNEGNFIVEWFSLDDNYNSLFTKPWTIISYGFLHAGFIHILFNLIALYFIGNLFIQYFTQKQLLTFYLLGTLSGGILYVFSQNYFPLFQGQSSYLVGASAGISAIFIGIATYMPNYQLKIPLIGFIKVWHLAAIWVGFDVLGLIGDNAGGNFAHLGGSLFGFLYVYRASNKELNLWGSISSWFEKKEKPLKTVHKSGNKKQTTVKNNTPNQQQIDVILDKISKSGYDTLTKSEKEFLFKQGKR
ncbi:rhomboid family intramembrane serine protease [Polaribacter haliotis]|uniref:Rhomboid family intramembrane serine protease n=1 Tax=Polaribacter haliotis TaxID=1888915 RepID=A0A7L8AGQ9_9FLAO|nr:rhomboid family intramembrane serine protease [Polaribacter haliotis]QOD61191.1 rhomboid family intramembrane serine protease [Polaribacter haliotis]